MNSNEQVSYSPQLHQPLRKPLSSKLGLRARFRIWPERLAYRQNRTATAVFDSPRPNRMHLRSALAIAREDSAGGADTDLIRSAARMLGFRRVGSDLQARLAAGLQ